MTSVTKPLAPADRENADLELHTRGSALEASTSSWYRGRPTSRLARRASYGVRQLPGRSVLSTHTHLTEQIRRQVDHVNRRSARKELSKEHVKESRRLRKTAHIRDNVGRIGLVMSPALPPALAASHPGFAPFHVPFGSSAIPRNFCAAKRRPAALPTPRGDMGRGISSAELRRAVSTHRKLKIH